MESVFGRVRNETSERGKYGLVSVKAGKLQRKPGTNILQADHRKGVIYMQMASDELLHFYWKERARVSREVEDDYIIFPEEAEFIKIDECTTGRVYALKFKSSSQIHFYWMQEYSDEKDKETASLINQLIADPVNTTRTINSHNNSSSRGTDDSSTSQLLQLFGAASQDALQDFNWEVLSPTAEAPAILPRFPNVNESANMYRASSESNLNGPHATAGENGEDHEEATASPLDENIDYTHSRTLELLEQLQPLILNETTFVEPFSIDRESHRVITHPRVYPKIFPHSPSDLLRISGRAELSENRDFFKHLSSLMEAVAKPESESLREICNLSLEQVQSASGAELFLHALYDRLVNEGVIVISHITQEGSDGEVEEEGDVEMRESNEKDE
ncbi:19S proteasome regulatory subunit [Schizosaccharomyces pombe]|uniref:Proteasomal ubiquitin receptor ADRM1 homolog rpn1302 n=1 Tax=Schizosaccharomyces pombe (strain 972 / ATCC 24843) TaxID=284812 RepID=RP13B_SCHPO|nr:19S proteasome regulatory subunit rpn1302 [Schizosaccharomyces pombe]Q9USM1.1 RecName: Full=Proteasomal ubiquitin receptor ADRM1 homolog rpn1302; AltName: Full=Regulatory particle non-ATPase 13ba protein [Schizosaccharomyces pombe 972h-]CAB53088.1 19S proteasome regulatory subunit Rpn13b [Schizosaccharomyces pombe]|eukprot:NP_588003.1 19S proteasome regulatory subunit rpn1302 [Schizosaccharomyces pombe]